jgi:uncharacterized phiE125 gp8 family phage protein
VASIQYFDVNGTLTTLDPSSYWLALLGEPARIRPVITHPWPITQYGRPEAVAIQFTAGYGDITKVPADLRAAIKIILTDRWRNRGGEPMVDIPAAAKRLIANHRYAGYH